MEKLLFLEVTGMVRFTIIFEIGVVVVAVESDNNFNTASLQFLDDSFGDTSILLIAVDGWIFKS